MTIDSKISELAVWLGDAFQGIELTAQTLADDAAAAEASRLAAEAALSATVLAASAASGAAVAADAAVAEALAATHSIESLPALLASTRTYPVGTIISTRAEGYSYVVVSSADDATTAGGVKLKVVRGDLRAFGAVGDGVTDDWDAISRAQVSGLIVSGSGRTYKTRNQPVMEQFRDAAFIVAGVSDALAAPPAISTPGEVHIRNVRRGAALTPARLQAAVDSLPSAGGTIILPPWEVRLSGLFTGFRDGVTIKGHRGATRLTRSDADQVFFDVGVGRAEGDRIKDVSFLDFDIDGKGLNDSGDDCPHIRMRYVDGGRVSGITARNGSTVVRIGRGDLGWSLEDQRTRYIEVSDITAHNMQFFGVEGHGYLGCQISDVRFFGGARSTGATCAGIRSVKGYQSQWSNILIDKPGRGIIASGAPDDEQGFITFDNITVEQPQYGYALDMSGPWRNLKINQITARGSGPSQPVVARLGLTSGVDTQVMNSVFESLSSTNTDCLRIDNGNTDGTISNCTFRDRFTGHPASVYGLRLNACGGIWDVRGNQFDLADPTSNARGFYNVSPVAGSYVTSRQNLYLTSAAATRRGADIVSSNDTDMTRYT